MENVSRMQQFLGVLNRFTNATLLYYEIPESFSGVYLVFQQPADELVVKGTYVRRVLRIGNWDSPDLDVREIPYATWLGDKRSVFNHTTHKFDEFPEPGI